MHKTLSLPLELPFAEACNRNRLPTSHFDSSRTVSRCQRISTIARIYIFRFYKFGLKKLFYFCRYIL
jgi:hypothetical protein